MLLPPFLAALRIHEVCVLGLGLASALGLLSAEDVSRFLAFLFSRHASSPRLHRCLDTKCLACLWRSSKEFVDLCSFPASMSEVGSCTS